MPEITHDWRFDDGSGGTVTEYEQGLDGTIVNGSWVADSDFYAGTGLQSTALEIDVGHDASLNFDDSFVLYVEIKYDAVAGYTGLMTKGWNNTTNYSLAEYGLGHDSSGRPHMQIFYPSGSSTRWSGFNPSTGTLYRYAGRYLQSASQLEIFINGSSYGTAATTSDPHNTTNAFGLAHDAGRNRFPLNGSMGRAAVIQGDVSDDAVMQTLTADGLDAIAGGEPTFELSGVSFPSTVTEGEPVTVTGTVTNTGDDVGTQDIGLNVTEAATGAEFLVDDFGAGFAGGWSNTGQWTTDAHAEAVGGGGARRTAGDAGSALWADGFGASFPADYSYLLTRVYAPATTTFSWLGPVINGDGASAFLVCELAANLETIEIWEYDGGWGAELAASSANASLLDQPVDLVTYFDDAGALHFEAYDTSGTELESVTAAAPTSYGSEFGIQWHHSAYTGDMYVDAVKLTDQHPVENGLTW